ncbi:sugar ABC transporter substrate-binding protein [Paenibacillus sedimenti]|uniref:Substrate-binding domain-containing protein n=1 Tax=Paenibacillus sedimenti TaxID=2770274 RepID=A0A926KPI4_9BACL|nr:substrate-binding domain-containing protein [Paenibacillus sedimenti]MBD0381525.1 substrate-binding domain-containing protein [Paenibacillus sedimenti]
MSSRYKFIRNLCLPFLLVLTLASCKVPEPSNDPAFGSPPLQETTKAPDKERKVTSTFGILYPMANPFYEMITELVEQAAEPESVKLIVKAPDEINLEQQILMMETMIKQKVDGIAISPIDPVALAPVINKAVSLGIPVICFETDVPASKRLSYIGTDSYHEGYLMGAIIKRYLKGKGMIMVEGGLSESPQQKRRLEGMLQYLKWNTEIQVLEIRFNEGQSDRDLSDLEDMIDEHPHFDAFVSLDLISSSNSILIWKAQGLKRDSLTFGMSPEVKEALLNGQITSVISENEHLWGQWIVQQLLLASEGKNVPSFIDTGIQEVTVADLPLSNIR